MTKKDFILVASIIKNSKLSTQDKELIAIDFADYFEYCNERFKRNLFLTEACGVENGN
jgi:hypothetical protein